MWLSLICTKLKSVGTPPAGDSSLAARATPPDIAYTIPVPAHAIHSKKPRRLIPSVLMIGSFCCLACPYRPLGANIPGNFLPVAQVLCSDGRYDCLCAVRAGRN